MEALWTVALLPSLIALGVSLTLSQQDKRTNARLARIERKLELIMHHLGLVEPEPELPEVLRQLEHGRKIHAIKAYRQATGEGLKEAKDAVEEMARKRGL
jgi:ribosomal protein L7/L12